MCICEPANLWGWILTGVNLLLVLMRLYRCHLWKAHAQFDGFVEREGWLPRKINSVSCVS